MLDKQTLQKLNEFLSIENGKYLFYHRDQDGICSAALMAKFYPGFKTATKKGPRIAKEELEALIKKEPDLVVFLDLPVDQEWKLLKKFQKAVPSAKIVIIDHHVYEKNMNSENIVHINPLFTKKVYQSTSYLIYNILKRLIGTKVKRYLWIAMMGAIGDYDLSSSEDLIKECKKNYPHLLGDDPHNSDLSKGSKLMSAVITLKDWKGANEVFETLVQAETYEDFSSVKKYKEYQKEVDREFRRVIKSAEKEEYPEYNLVIYKIETDFSMVSNTSNHFSRKYPDKIVIVRKKSYSEWKFSARFQTGKINLGKIVKRAVAGIGSGGGHPKASAGIISDWEKFKGNFIKELKRIKS